MFRARLGTPAPVSGWVQARCGVPAWFWVACLVLGAGLGCYSTHGLPPAALGVLGQSGHPREILLSSGQQGRVRIGPGSLVRFHRVDGAATEWTAASNVRIAPDLIVIGWGPAGPQILRWQHVAGIEVNELDMGRTVVGAVGGTTLVLVAAATEVLVLGALAAMHVRVDEVGFTRAAIEGVVSQAGRHLDGDPAAPVRPEESDVSPEEVLTARPLFSAQARRRDLVRASLAVESGAETGLPVLEPQFGLMGSLRVLHVLELGLGMNLTDPGPLLTTAEAATAPLAQRLRLSARGRVGLHLDLDMARRVALLLAEEVAVSPGGWVDARTVWGLRFRLGESWQVGLLPMNPRVAWSTREPLSRTSFASTFEVAWVF